MANTPKDNEQKIVRMLGAWESLAPAKTFAGMTLQQFRAAVEPALDARRRLDALDAQRQSLTAARDSADDEALRRAQQVVAGVLADPTEGPDSPLYEAFGYTRKSERKSGLTRKRETPPEK
jgi:hypothetical protein